MSLSRRLSSALLSLYRGINQTGILDRGWVQTLFISSYFAYKKHLEDANAKLVNRYPSLFKGGHILDIGANIGYTSYVFSRVLSSPYKVLAFEPEKRNVRILQKAAKLYHFSDKVTVTPSAVGDKVGTIDIWQNDSHHADHRVLTDELRKQLKGRLQVQKVPLVTVDHFLNNEYESQPIAFIKIDVQGYESAVCYGMEQTLRANPNCVVEFEYCPMVMESLGFRAEDLIEFFLAREYFLYKLNKNGTLAPLHFETNKINQLGKGAHDYIDIICSKNKITTHNKSASQ